METNLQRQSRHEQREAEVVRAIHDACRQLDVSVTCELSFAHGRPRLSCTYDLNRGVRRYNRTWLAGLGFSFGSAAGGLVAHNYHVLVLAYTACVFLLMLDWHAPAAWKPPVVTMPQLKAAVGSAIAKLGYRLKQADGEVHLYGD